LDRRSFIVVAGLFATSALAQQDYPSRPIRMIISASQGGTTDLLARLIGARLGETLKQPVVLENKPSGFGVLAAELTAAAPADGYTLLACWHTHTINAAMNANLSYDPVESFTPITQFTSAGLLLVVNPAAPARNLAQFIDWAKTSKEPLQFGSAGTGSGGHLAGELLKVMTGAKGQHIPYKGTGPAMTDLLAGRYDFIFTALQGAPPNLVRAGKLRAIAVTTPRRLAAWPDLPAMAEALPGFEVTGWYGLLAPAKLPKPIAMRLYEEVRKALERPDIRERILADGAEPVGSTPEEFRQYLLADVAKWTKVVKASGAKLD
jgi:tripartite-type tricarboxylate transporter receptor subunit TctC